jgi:6-phosphogluconolactonase (cycloisomerase 2 family)
MTGLVAALALVALCAASPDAAEARALRAGAVFVLTNQPTNEVVAFARAQDGTLTRVGAFATGGAGDPVPQGQDPPTDPLASQGALVQDGRFLFAVNAGSNEVSVLAISRKGLTLVDKVDSGGVRPISLTVFDDLLYVLNEGGTPNITGFTIGAGGALTPLEGSTRPLAGGAAADPAQVEFSPDGAWLVVTEKATNQIDVYAVADDGLAAGPIASPSSGMTPFGFAFDNRGAPIVSEAFGGTPNASATSSYTIADDGTLDVVSASMPDFQTAACWVVITNSGRFAYVSNTGSGSVSSYRIGAGSTLTLLDSTAGVTGDGSSPIDMALDRSSRFLYVHAAGLQSVAAFRVSPRDGSLTPIGTFGGLPLGAQGIAAL